MPRIKVLIIDDSAVVRKMMSEVLSKESRIEVVATALDPFIAAEKIKTLHPDVITLDIEMPRMDGLTFLSKLMIAQPMPVIMVSSHTESGALATIKALEAGAVDCILKPGYEDSGEKWKSFGKELAEKIIGASKASVRRRPASVFEMRENIGKVSSINHSRAIIAIGASTGGTEVITEILRSMTLQIPGIVVTQHMPPKFTEAFAKRMDSLSEINVKEAEHGDRVYSGSAYVAPGGSQMLVRRDTLGFWIEVNDDPPVNRHKPSVNVLFESVSRCAGEMATGILLTGMGSDGASGLLTMRESGSYTIAQDERSSIVFGMPREAIKIGAACDIMNIEQIIQNLRTRYLNDFNNR
jgi:two-component system chemotaxis response regulator CheB